MTPSPSLLSNLTRLRLHDAITGTDGYSMSDIMYDWKDATAVGMEQNLRLPQFDIVGKNQFSKVINLSTGTCDPRAVRAAPGAVLL